jgi:hypothetical protein
MDAKRYFLIIGLILIVIFLIFPFLAQAQTQTLCSYDGPDVSQHLLRLTNFTVEGPSSLQVGDKITVKFTLQNYGQDNINFWKKGIFAATRDPDGNDASFGYSFKNDTIEPFESRSFESSRLLTQVQDSDNDGIPDDQDNCPNTPNQDQKNSDNDSLGDACDNCPTLTNQDQQNSDNDSFGDVCDNCKLTYNPDQKNSDNDTHGDLCDNCPTTTNENQSNSDKDTLGDACDNCPTVTNQDQQNSDNDSHGNACDNCPTTTNENQNNSDQDTLGDACDNCPTITNQNQQNSDNDSITILMEMPAIIVPQRPMRIKIIPIKIH